MPKKKEKWGNKVNVTLPYEVDKFLREYAEKNKGVKLGLFLRELGIEFYQRQKGGE